jgi:2-polyprenyl-3-methyl-5-hydroxy-6-metoxy-1,4-benzoquinol methylase
MSASSDTKVAQFNDYWDELRQSSRYHPANRFRYHLIQKLVPMHCANPKHIMDIGCGDGELLGVLSTIYPNAALTGCDVSANQVAINIQRRPNMAFIHADAAQAGLKAKLTSDQVLGVDLITSSEVIEHVIDDQMFLNNVAEILSPGGVFFLTTQSGKQYRMDKEVLGHLRHYNREALCKMAEKAGLKIVSSYNCGFPILSLQKRIVDIFFDSVMRSVGHGNKPGFIARSIMSLMYVGLCAAPKVGGPQLVLIATKPK